MNIKIEGLPEYKLAVANKYKNEIKSAKEFLAINLGAGIAGTISLVAGIVSINSDDFTFFAMGVTLSITGVILDFFAAVNALEIYHNKSYKFNHYARRKAIKKTPQRYKIKFLEIAHSILSGEEIICEFTKHKKVKNKDLFKFGEYEYDECELESLENFFNIKLYDEEKLESEKSLKALFNLLLFSFGIDSREYHGVEKEEDYMCKLYGKYFELGSSYLLTEGDNEDGLMDFPNKTIEYFDLNQQSNQKLTKPINLQGNKEYDQTK